MTIFRSKALDLLGTILIIVGFIGFMVCWKTGWDAQERILTTNEFGRHTPQHPAAIQMKGRTFYVEPDYAWRFKLADDFIFAFWAVAAAGMAIKKRDKIEAWWKIRRERGARVR